MRSRTNLAAAGRRTNTKAFCRGQEFHAVDSIIFTNYNPEYEIKATSWSSSAKFYPQDGTVITAHTWNRERAQARQNLCCDQTARSGHSVNMGEINVCGCARGSLYETHLAYGIFSSSRDSPTLITRVFAGQRQL